MAAVKKVITYTRLSKLYLHIDISLIVQAKSTVPSLYNQNVHTRNLFQHTVLHMCSPFYLDTPTNYYKTFHRNRKRTLAFGLVISLWVNIFSGNLTYLSTYHDSYKHLANRPFHVKHSYELTVN